MLGEAGVMFCHEVHEIDTKGTKATRIEGPVVDLNKLEVELFDVET